MLLKRADDPVERVKNVAAKISKLKIKPDQSSAAHYFALLLTT
jgi:hypothetical protein